MREIKFIMMSILSENESIDMNLTHKIPIEQYTSDKGIVILTKLFRDLYCNNKLWKLKCLPNNKPEYFENKNEAITRMEEVLV
jgi:hypothetical protein